MHSLFNSVVQLVTIYIYNTAWTNSANMLVCIRYTYFQGWQLFTKYPTVDYNKITVSIHSAHKMIVYTFLSIGKNDNFKTVLYNKSLR